MDDIFADFTAPTAATPSKIMEALSALGAFLTRGLSPTLSTILVTFLIVITVPALLHIYIYRSAVRTVLPNFLLTGPSNSGKTSLMTTVERGSPSATHTSQAPFTVECSVPVAQVTRSNRFRSVNDPGHLMHRKFTLTDTPGHGKLRHFAVSGIAKPHHLRGIIFVVDASALSAGSGEENGGLTETAQYLHDLLIILQKRHTAAKSSKGPSSTPVLILANKLDLFTALPAKLVKTALEQELTKLRTTKSKGLLDSGVGMDEQADDEDILGGGGEGKFEFSLMEEYNVPVHVAGASVAGEGGANISEIWAWIAECL